MFVNSAVSQYPSLAFQFAFDQAGENFHTAALMLRWTRILVRLRRCCQEDSSMTPWPDHLPSGNQKRFRRDPYDWAEPATGREWGKGT
jgi:hypothetical protein